MVFLPQGQIKIFWRFSQSGYLVYLASRRGSVLLYLVLLPLATGLTSGVHLSQVVEGGAGGSVGLDQVPCEQRDGSDVVLLWRIFLRWTKEQWVMDCTVHLADITSHITPQCASVYWWYCALFSGVAFTIKTFTYWSEVCDWLCNHESAGVWLGPSEKAPLWSLLF